jgi:hypothetical protein
MVNRNREKLEHDVSPSSESKIVRLGEIAQVQRGVFVNLQDGHYHQIRGVAERSYPVIAYDHLKEYGFVDLNEVYANPIESSKISLPETYKSNLSIEEQFGLRAGDLLVTVFPENRKYYVILIGEKQLTGATLFSRALMRIRVTDTSVTPEQLFRFLVSANGQAALRSAEVEHRLFSSTVVPLRVEILPTITEHENTAFELSEVMSTLNFINDEMLPNLLRLKTQPLSVVESDEQLKKTIETLQSKLNFLIRRPLRELVMEEYPTPIALPYRYFEEAKFDIFEQVARLEDLFEAISFFVFNVTLADACHNLDMNVYYISDNNYRHAFKKDSMIHRMEFVSNILRIAKTRTRKDLFLATLAETNVANTAKDLQDKLRNPRAHSATASEARHRQILKEFQPQVEEMLVELDFLSAYSLVDIPIFTVKNKTLRAKMNVYKGVTPYRAEENFGDSSNVLMAEHNHLLLLDPDYKLLDLHPFYQLISNKDTHYNSHLCFYKKEYKDEKEDKRKLLGESIPGAFELYLDGYDDYKNLTQRLEMNTDNKSSKKKN